MPTASAVQAGTKLKLATVSNKKSYQLAQLNIAKSRYGMDAPEMQGFNDRLDPVNSSADQSPGFVWRLQSEEGNATQYSIFDDPSYLVNISVWASFETLRDFIRSLAHIEVMRQRRDWFEVSDLPYLVLWWVPAGHQPTMAEAQERLEHLREHGPTARAFSFSRPFPATAEEATN
jgi:hypothetical protein